MRGGLLSRPNSHRHDQVQTLVLLTIFTTTATNTAVTVTPTAAAATPTAAAATDPALRTTHDSPDNAYCAGMTLLPVPLVGFWSNRSDLALVHHIHACPRSEKVCIGGLTNVSDAAIDKQVAAKECWLPESLTSDVCSSDGILW